MGAKSKKTAQWVISQAGFQSLMLAGISIGWLKAWVLSAGASEVNLHVLESNAWQQHENATDWQLFYATKDELHSIATNVVQNRNRNRNRNRNSGRIYQLFIPIGDIAYKRNSEWLADLRLKCSESDDEHKPSALYIRADDSLPITLEAGLTASLSPPSDGLYLNAEGLLIEEQLIATLQQQGLHVRTVESCTAGSIISRLCRVPGASAVVDRAWVTYSNTAKQEEVNVATTLIEQYGAVSQEVVIAMAEGGAKCGTDRPHYCLAVSGIAGPEGGTKDKPVGTVWIAIALEGQDTISQCLHINGARHEIQSRTVVAILALLQHRIEDCKSR